MNNVPVHRGYFVEIQFHYLNLVLGHNFQSNHDVGVISDKSIYTIKKSIPINQRENNCCRAIHW